MVMAKYTQMREFCPNTACSDYGKIPAEQSTKNIIKFGRSKSGKQRYKCLTCGKTFTETIGTIFYRRRTAAQEMLEVLSQIAEGSRISSVARTSGHKEDTISDWVKAASRHAEAIEEILLAEYQIEEGQLDGLWSYVGNKGEKKTMPRPKRADNSSARR
jgi:transposase-like protein